MRNLASRRIERYRTASREATGQVTGFLGEVFGAVQAVKVAGAEAQRACRLLPLDAQRRRAARQRARPRVHQVLNAVYWNTVNSAPA